MLPHELVDLVDLINRYDKIEIETDQRLHVGVDSLTANHAEAHFVLLEQSEDFLQEIGFVQSDAFQKESAFIQRVISD